MVGKAAVIGARERNGKIGTNVIKKTASTTLEGFVLGAMLKRGSKGTYHKMSAKHISRYVTEFAGRHNIRALDTIIQMILLAKGLHDKQLRYNELVAAP